MAMMRGAFPTLTTADVSNTRDKLVFPSWAVPLQGTGVFAWVGTLSSRRGLFADHQGSIIAVTDASGSAFAINGYDAWGVPNPDNSGRSQYTGQAWTPELGVVSLQGTRVFAMVGAISADGSGGV